MEGIVVIFSTTFETIFLAGDVLGVVFRVTVFVWEIGGADFATVFSGADDFLGAGFFAADVFVTGVFLVGLFFEVIFVFIMYEIVGKQFRKSKKSTISALLSFLFYLYYSHAR